MAVPWTRGELQYLRWYASRGLSGMEASILLNHRFGHARTKSACVTKAFMLDIAFHSGNDGAPFYNDSGKFTRFTEVVK